MTEPTSSEALGGRLLAALTGAAELMTIELGRELGLYDALRGQHLTAAELAKTAGIDQRYAREWLEQQAAAGILAAATPTPDPDARAFTLPEPAAAVLLDAGGPYYLGVAGQFAVGLGLVTPRVVEAFRTGAGVPYADYGVHFRHGIAELNRPRAGDRRRIREPERSGRGPLRPGRGAGRHRPAPRAGAARRGRGAGRRRSGSAVRGRRGVRRGGHPQPARRSGRGADQLPGRAGAVAPRRERHIAGRRAAQPRRAAGPGRRGRDRRAGGRGAAGLAVVRG